MSIQFQEHIAQITNARTSQAQLAAIGAIDYFQYLPAIGIRVIPIVGANLTRGFALLKFFQNIPHRDPVSDRWGQSRTLDSRLPVLPTDQAR